MSIHVLLRFPAGSVWVSHTFPCSRRFPPSPKLPTPNSHLHTCIHTCRGLQSGLSAAHTPVVAVATACTSGSQVCSTLRDAPGSSLRAGRNSRKAVLTRAADSPPAAAQEEEEVEVKLTNLQSSPLVNEQVRRRYQSRLQVRGTHTDNA
jgi:hypothetical protein